MADPLITVTDLAAIIDHPSVRICDVRWYLADHAAGPAAYAEAHIPGAIFVNLDEHLSVPEGPGRHPLPDRATTAGTLGALGIGDEHTVVVYDDRGGAIAARLWWMLRDLGHKEVRVLDGGIPAWTEAGHTVASEVSDLGAAVLTVRQATTRSIDREALASRLGTLTVLDARAPERYRGEDEPIDPIGGHIPTALNAPYEDSLTASGSFISREALTERFRSLGVEDPDTVVYCGSGVTACHNILAIVASGLPEPILYPGSWSDWSSSGMEIATG